MKTLHETKVSAVLADDGHSGKELVAVSVETSVADALKVLQENKISSMPVYGKKGQWLGAGGEQVIVGERQYIGMVSMLDFASYLFELLNEKKDLEKGTKESVLFLIGKTLETQSIWAVEEDSSLWNAMELLNKGVHRVIVTGKDKCSIMSQSDVVRYLSRNEPDLLKEKDIFDRTLEKAGYTGKDNSAIVAVAEDSVKQVMELLLGAGWSAILVLESAKHFGTFSLSDLRDVDMCDKKTLEELKSVTVQDFLLKKPENKKEAIALKSTATVKEAMEAMLDKKVHRVWVQGETPADLYGVFSLTDIIKLFFEEEIGEPAKKRQKLREEK